MNLIEEAVIIEIFGIRMYAFGAYVSLGAVLALAVLFFSGYILHLKKDSIILTSFLSVFCGITASRLFFCLLNQELGRLTPLSFWLQLNGGGWSMFGMISGIYLGGWISAILTKEKAGLILDSLSIAMLPLVAAERIGENRIEDFDISRPLDSTFLSGSFLVVGEDEPCLATYYVAAAAAIILFAILLYRFSRKDREGNVAVAFLLLFGATSIITESLRYDRFLSVSFVGLQQIAAALMLGIGIIVAVRRCEMPSSKLAIASIISLPAMTGAVIGLEFALDRTTWNKIMIYAIMIVTVSIPAIMGLKMLNQMRKGQHCCD